MDDLDPVKYIKVVFLSMGLPIGKSKIIKEKIWHIFAKEDKKAVRRTQ